MMQIYRSLDVCALGIHIPSILLNSKEAIEGESQQCSLNHGKQHQAGDNPADCHSSRL